MAWFAESGQFGILLWGAGLITLILIGAYMDLKK
jgi:hypothetical protein